MMHANAPVTDRDWLLGSSPAPCFVDGQNRRLLREPRQPDRYPPEQAAATQRQTFRRIDQAGQIDRVRHSAPPQPRQSHATRREHSAAHWQITHWPESAMLCAPMQRALYVLGKHIRLRDSRSVHACRSLCRSEALTAAGRPSVSNANNRRPFEGAALKPLQVQHKVTAKPNDDLHASRGRSLLGRL